MNDDPGSSPGSPHALELGVLYQSGGWQVAIDDIEALAEAAVVATLSAVDWNESVELCLCLADDPFIQDLNARYRGKDKPTNVLSFPQNDDRTMSARPAGQPLLLGDIVLSLDRLRYEAKSEGKRLEEHFQHLVVHGTLHLLGHDHEESDDARVMEDLERAILARLGVADPYAEPLEKKATLATEAKTS